MQFASMMPKKATQQPITVGASVIALKYKDGVMMAADTVISYGNTLKFQNCPRISKAGSHTLVGAAGEYSDFQYLQDMLSDLDEEDWQHQDGASMGPKQVGAYLSRVLYNRRSKMNPLWNQLLIGGVSKNGDKILQYVDSQGTAYEEEFQATGFGMHLAMPLLRAKWRADMTEAEAKELCEECLRVLFYRDCKASCKIQIATSKAQGARVGDAYKISSKWDLQAFTQTSLERGIKATGATW